MASYSSRYSIQNCQLWILRSRVIRLFLSEFYSNYMYAMYVMLCICFCYGNPLKRMGANNRFRERSHGVIKIYAISMRLQDPIPKSHCNHRIFFNDTFKSAESSEVGIANLFSSRLIVNPLIFFLIPLNTVLGVDWWKKSRVKISCHCPFKEMDQVNFQNDVIKTWSWRSGSCWP
jgi:hypothetical protein